MRRNQYTTYVCNDLNAVKTATDDLDKVSAVPLFIDNSGVMKKVDNFKGVYNISTGRFCCAVVNNYNVISHKQYFDAFADAMNRLKMKYTMTIKQHNNRAYADIEFLGRNLKFDKLNEEFVTGVRLANSYDKSLGLSVVPRFTRLACTNGMILTRSEKTLSIKHHTKLLAEIESFVEKRLNLIIQKDAELQGWVSDSMKDSLEWDLCCRILEKLFDQPKHLEQILKRLNVDLIIVKDKEKNVEGFTYFMDDKVKRKKFSRWEIYNAITHYITHGEHISPFVENLFQKHAEKVLITPLQKMPMAEIRIRKND